MILQHMAYNAGSLYMQSTLKNIPLQLASQCSALNPAPLARDYHQVQWLMADCWLHQSNLGKDKAIMKATHTYFKVHVPFFLMSTQELQNYVLTQWSLSLQLSEKKSEDTWLTVQNMYESWGEMLYRLILPADIKSPMSAHIFASHNVARKATSSAEKREDTGEKERI